MFEGQVKEETRWSTVTCAGLHFNKTQWLPIPAHKVEECEINAMVKVREVAIEEPIEEAEAPEAEAVEAGPVAEFLEGNLGQVGARVRVCEDLELLEAALEVEERIGAKDAIKARISELREAPEAEKDGDV